MRSIQRAAAAAVIAVGLLASPSVAFGETGPQPKCDVNGKVTFSPGLTAAPSAVGVKLHFTGTLTNCVNFPVVSTATGPVTITGGKWFIILAGTLPGATCSKLVTGFGSTPATKLVFKLTGLRNGKPASATSNSVTQLASVTEQTSPLGDTAVSNPINSVTNPFIGLTPKLTIVYDETAAQRAALCAIPKKRMLHLHFGTITDRTGSFSPVNGKSQFSLS
jgi:hypothetical protein